MLLFALLTKLRNLGVISPREALEIVSYAHLVQFLEGKRKGLFTDVECKYLDSIHALLNDGKLEEACNMCPPPALVGVFEVLKILRSNVVFFGKEKRGG